MELYLRALECSEKVIEYFPRCATAHYSVGFARLKIKGDQIFAKHKIDLLQSFKSDDADALATRLKDELERTRAVSNMAE